MLKLFFLVDNIRQRIDNKNLLLLQVSVVMFFKFKWAKYSLIFLIAFLIATINFSSVTFSAEKINFNYSLLGFKVLVKDLSDFAKQGTISSHLNFYLKRISADNREELRSFLNQSYDVDPVLVYRYSRTSVGIRLLERIGEIIQLPGNINGFYGLRAAVVQTAQLKDETNFINFLQQFPTDIKLNLGETLKLVKAISNSEKETEKFIESLETKSNQSQGNFNNNLNDIPDLSASGEYIVSKKTLKIYDKKRDRLLNTDLYLPQENIQNIPIIVVSNGLGAKRDRFEELAQHLASYGFGVVIPDHPGSDRQRQKDFLKGLYRENFDGTDFIDRPLDISYILDELEILNQKQLNNRLNLKQVGIFGYSIGGTTALSLAGANIDFHRLEQECAKSLDLLNISTLYQCRATELSQNKPSLKDSRIKAAFMFVPFGNIMFSQDELNKVSIPMMWQVVDKDFLTSLLTEQIPLFNGLVNSDSYLVISEKIPHSNVTLSTEQQSTQGKIFQTAKKYQNILSLVFFQNYVVQNPKYKQYLNQEYLNKIENLPYKLHLIKDKAEISR